MTRAKKRKSKTGEYEFVGRDPDTGMIYVNTVDEIPIFSSDEEEADFWDTHVMTPKMFEPRGMSLAEALRQANARQHPAER